MDVVVQALVAMLQIVHKVKRTGWYPGGTNHGLGGTNHVRGGTNHGRSVTSHGCGGTNYRRGVKAVDIVVQTVLVGGTG